MRAEAAAVAASDLFTQLKLSEGERQLALLLLVTLEIAGDSNDFPQYLKNLELSYSLARRYAELTRPGIEAAIRERPGRTPA